MGGIPLKHKNIFHIVVYLGSRGVSQIGDFMLLVAINLLVLNKTNSPQAVSILWIIPAVAQLIISPWAGSITDRRDKRLTMVFVEAIRAALIAAMAISSQLWCLYTALFLVNGVGTFFASASSPYVNYLVPNHRRKRVNAVMGTLQSGALIVGPALTGLILRISGSLSLSIWIDASSFATSAVCLLLLPSLKSKPSSVESDGKKHALKMWCTDLNKAFQILRQRVLFTALFMLVTLVGVLGAATDSQEAVFARTALGLSSSSYSLLIAVAGIGYIVGALFVTAFSNKISLQFLIGVGSVLSSCGFVIYAWSDSFFTACVGFIILGIFQSLSNAGFSTYYQLSLPAEFMGRVGNLTAPLTQILIIVFTILVGLTASAIGVRNMTIGSTAVMFLLGLVTLVTIWSRRARISLLAVEKKLSS